MKTKKTWSHKDLVTVAAKWLRNVRKCHAVIAELNLVSSDEIPDAIGWDFMGRSVLIEVKASRSDFLVDKHKTFRKHAHFGMGLTRYYMCPMGMIHPQDLCVPEEGTGELLWNGWGILEVDNSGRVHRMFDSRKFIKRNERMELRQLVGTLRRVQTRLNEPVWEFIKNWADPATPEDDFHCVVPDEQKKVNLAWLFSQCKPTNFVEVEAKDA
jgi:hypothetical protein